MPSDDGLGFRVLGFRVDVPLWAPTPKESRTQARMRTAATWMSRDSSGFRVEALNPKPYFGIVVTSGVQATGCFDCSLCLSPSF